MNASDHRHYEDTEGHSISTSLIGQIGSTLSWCAHAQTVFLKLILAKIDRIPIYQNQFEPIATDNLLIELHD